MLARVCAGKLTHFHVLGSEAFERSQSVVQVPLLRGSLLLLGRLGSPFVLQLAHEFLQLPVGTNGVRLK